MGYSMKPVKPKPKPKKNGPVDNRPSNEIVVRKTMPTTPPKNMPPKKRGMGRGR